MLDRTTLRLLSENQRVRDFNLSFSRRLANLLLASPTQQQQQLINVSPIEGVTFQADTDNRHNFPNEASFHVFKKQRDGFFELMRGWQEKHAQADWSLLQHDSRRIFELVTSRATVASHVHLARLFTAQLLLTCRNEVSMVGESDDEQHIALLAQLKLQNPDKFHRSVHSTL